MLGVIYGIISAVAYGVIPLFTLPLYEAGISAETAIAYRFGLAAVAMAVALALMGKKFRVSRTDFFKLGGLSAVYLFAVISYFQSFRYLPSSVACTIQFLYPVMVMLIMIGFFKERFNWLVALAVVLGISGVALLSVGADASQSGQITPNHVMLGIFFSLMAGLGNSLFMVGIQVLRLPHIDGFVMTFYVMFFGALYSLANALACRSLQWINTPRELGLAVLLAVVTAVISNLTLILSIKKIGSTIASILGAMEPVTAVCIGVFFFGEPFTDVLASGISLIIISVLIALFVPKKIQAGQASLD